ncbi:MAG: hypothetical protein ACKPCM_02215, partial [Pseudanabaena sp.]
FDIDKMASISKEFSGAEIEQAIVEAMYRAFHEQRDVKTEDIIGAIKDTYPLASTAREQISFMQAWATQGRARSASRGENTARGENNLHSEIVKQGNNNSHSSSNSATNSSRDISVINQATKAALEKSIDLSIAKTSDLATIKRRPLPPPPLPQIKSSSDS